MLNQARLKVLKVREDHVRTVLDEARRRLGEVVRNPQLYGEVLKSLTVQALLQVSRKICIFMCTSMHPFYHIKNINGTNTVV